MKPNAYRDSWAIARNSFATHQRKLLVDISVLVEHDAKREFNGFLAVYQ